MKATLFLLVVVELEDLAPSVGPESLSLGFNAFELEGSLLGDLSLSLENRLGLSTITSLLPVVNSSSL